MDDFDESDPDQDGEPMIDDLTIIITLLAVAIAVFYILYSNWPTSPRSSPKQQEPSNILRELEDTNSSEVDKPEDLLFDDSDEDEMDLDLPEDEEYYMVKIDHGLMCFKKIEGDSHHEQKRHHTIENEETSSDEDENDSDLDLTPEEYEEYLTKIDDGLMSAKKRKDDSNQEQESHHAVAEIQEPSDIDASEQSNVLESVQETHLAGSREDIRPAIPEHESAHDESKGESPSTFDRDTFQLSDSYVEITAADVPEDLDEDLKKKLSIDEEDAIQIAHENHHAEDESVEGTAKEKDNFEAEQEEAEAEATLTEGTTTEMSLDESREDAFSMEKDKSDKEHEQDVAEVTSTEGTTTEMSSDESREDASSMEEDKSDKEHEQGEAEVPSTEGTTTEMSSDESREDASALEKDNFDKEHKEGETEVTSTEGRAIEMSSDETEMCSVESREDVIPMAKDILDVDHEDLGANPDYVRVSGSVMEHQSLKVSPDDADSPTSDNGVVMRSSSSNEVAPYETSTVEFNGSPNEDQISETNEGDENCDGDETQNSEQEGSSSTEVAPCEASTMESNGSPCEDQSCKNNQGDETCDGDQVQNSQQESSEAEDIREDHGKQDVTLQLPAKEEDVSEE